MRSWMALLVLVCAACGGGSGDGDDDGGDGGVTDGGVDGPSIACSPGEIACGGACVDATSPATCGRCDHACGSGESCDRGTCVATCAGHRFDIDRPRSPAGQQPWMLALGRFDGDAALDAVVLGSSSSSATTVVFGSGGGVFGRLVSLASSSDPSHLWTGDVDGDGDDDILIVDDYDLHQFLSDGAGGFAPRISIEGFAFVRPVAADFTGDGRLDVVQLGSSGGQLRAGAPGGLAAPVTITGGSPDVITQGDADGDGDADLIYHDNNLIYVLRNSGSGAFPATVTSPAAATPDALHAGDFTGDDALDLIVVDGDGVTRLHAGAGGGSFAAGTALAIEPYSRATQIADLDGDGKDDLVMSIDGAVCVVRGGAAGLSAPRCVASPGGDAAGVAVANLIGGAELDVVVADEAQAGTIGVIPGLPGGMLDAPAITHLGYYVLGAVVTDLDGDEVDDLITGVVYDEEIHVVSEGATRAVFTTAGQPRQIVVADLDGGALDLVAATHSGIEVLLGAGALTSGATTPVVTDILNGLEGMAVADINGDGRRDLIALDDNRTRIRTFLATGPGTFATAAAATIDLTTSAQIAAADVTGDGYADVVISTDDEVRVHPGTIAGGLGPAITSQGSGSKVPVLADLDGDGDLDVMLRGLWLAGDGAGNFADPVIINFYADVFWIGDHDGDGHVDVLLETNSSIQRAHGSDGGFTIDRAWHVDGGIGGGGAGDADGDGDLDLMVIQSGGVRVIAGTGDSFALDLLSPAPMSLGLARGDLDEDGRDDLVLQAADSRIHVLLAVGSTGAPSFHTATVLPPAAAFHVVDADLDGHVDVVVDAAVYRGNGDGTLLAPVDPPRGLARTSTIGFVDGDAYPDMLIQSQVVGATRVWFGSPAGFVEGPELPRSVHACAADLDHDGHGDMMTATLGGYVLSVAHGDGTGMFASGTAVPGMNTGLTTVLTCRDLDGDTHPDVLATGASTAVGGAASLALVRGDGSSLGAPSFLALTGAATVDTPLLGGPTRALLTGGPLFQVTRLDGTALTADAITGAAVSGDFDGDHIPDAAIGSAGGVRVYLGRCD